MVSEAHYEVHIRQASIHTARTSDVDSVMFVNRIRKISHFLILFFFVPCSYQDEKNLSLFLHQAQTLSSFLFYLITYCLQWYDKLKNAWETLWTISEKLSQGSSISYQWRQSPLLSSEAPFRNKTFERSPVRPEVVYNVKKAKNEQSYWTRQHSCTLA